MSKGYGQGASWMMKAILGKTLVEGGIGALAFVIVIWVVYMVARELGIPD